MQRRPLNRFITRLADDAVLSLLWLFACLPVVTAPAATAALFAVAQRRSADRPPMLRSFAGAFRHHFRRATVVGFGWAGLGLILVIDLVIVGQMTGPAGTTVLVAVLSVALLYALGSVALVPVLVSLDARPYHLMRAAVLLVLMFPGRSLLALAFAAAAVAAVAVVPLAVLVVPGLSATAVAYLYRDALERLRHLSPPAAPPLSGAIPLAGLPSPTS